MIAVDTSAIVALLKAEPEEPRLRDRLEKAAGAVISTASLVELQLVICGWRAIAIWPDVERLLGQYSVTSRPFDDRQLALAREAAIRFGKGRHKAGLNFGDCFAYALAKSEGIPLLCTGADFALTDVAIA